MYFWGLLTACQSLRYALLSNSKQTLLTYYLIQGGHEIIRAFHSAGKDPANIQNIFISHWDSDHILGLVPLMRVFRSNPSKRTLYCSADVASAIESIFAYTGNSYYKKASEFFEVDVVGDSDVRKIGDWSVVFFDVHSDKTPQMGCSVSLEDGTKISYLGDEPYRESYRQYVVDSDILMHEAFCTSIAVERFKPYEKHHGTARDAGENAAKINAKQLVLFHSEDETLTTRKEAYLADARDSGFMGKVFVPVDSDILEF